MAKAYGYNGKLRLKKESAYGVSPAGNFSTLPFNTCDLGKMQGFQESPRAGAGRTKKEIFRDAPSVAGNVQVPACMRNMGLWLGGLLGAPDTTEDTGTYTHVFTSEETTIPSYAIEVGHPDVPAFYMNLGCMINTMSLDMARAGPAMVTFGLVGQSESKTTSTGAGTPTDRAASDVLSWASYLQGTVKKADAALGNLNSASFTYTNNMAALEFLNQTGGQVAGFDLGEVGVTGSLNMRFASTTEMDAATAGTPVDLDFVFSVDADLSLTFTLHEVYLEKTKAPITGPGGVNVDLSFTSKYNEDNSAQFTATLVNDEDGTLY